MSEETKETKAAVPAENKESSSADSGGKKLRPTNCAQSNKRIRRKDWYYRDGKYFANKQNYRLFVVEQKAKKEKEKEKQAAPAA